MTNKTLRSRMTLADRSLRKMSMVIHFLVPLITSYQKDARCATQEKSGAPLCRVALTLTFPRVWEKDVGAILRVTPTEQGVLPLTINGA